MKSITKFIKQMSVCFILFLGGLIPTVLFAQGRIVKGRVIDSITQLPVSGASILISGTKSGTISSLSGSFSLRVADEGFLVITNIGYKSMRVQPAGNDSLIVRLVPVQQDLNDVVVVGYGTQKKETLTGSVATVDAKSFENKGALASPLQAMQGQVPGVIITRSSSAPGDESWGVSIRGAVSANSTEPLVVLDGVAMDSYRDLRNINPSDIESISFLKDGAAAIYGSRAAGGVMLVTTKKGHAGKSTITFDPAYTRNIVGLQPHLMNLEQWANGVIEARQNDGYDDNDMWIQYGKLALVNQGKYIDLQHQANPLPAFQDVADLVFLDNDWTKILWGNAGSMQNNLSIAGGTSKSTYRLSLGYYYDDGTLQWGNNNNKRYNVRLNNNFQVTDKLSINSVISYNRQNQVSPTMKGNVLGQGYPQPGFPYETLTGQPYGWGGQYDPNWFAEAGGDNKLLVSQVNISENFTYEITKNLKAVANLGYNTSYAKRDIQQNAIQWYNYEGTVAGNESPTQANSYFQKTAATTDFYSASAYLAYNKVFNNIHHFAATAGVQYERNEYDYQSGQVNDINSSLPILKGNGVQTNSETKNHYAMGSYYGRLNYDFKSKYLFEVNGRYDGSSKFAPQNRWNAFYGVSTGWRISQEKFFRNNNGLNFISELKLRASYGVVGNQNGIALYDGVQLLTENSGTGPFLGAGKVSTVTPSGTLVSYDRTWERIKNYNLAVDFSMFDSRLSGTVEWFQKHNNNMLLSAAYSGVLGASAPQANIGKFKGYGWDGNLNWRDKIGQVEYSVGGDITFAKNVLTDFGGQNIIGAGFNNAVQGYPLHSVFGYRYAGRIQTEAELQQYLDKFNAGNAIGLSKAIGLGDNMYQDVNGDGKLNQDDLVYLGSDDPELSYAFNASVSYAGFDFSVIFQGAADRTIFRQDVNWRIPFRSVYLNTTNQSVGNEWTPENTGAFFPKYSTNSDINNYNYQPSTWSVENGAYIRLKNVVLGYSIPESLLHRIKVFSALRVYVAGADLWEYTHIHDGWDPEATRNVSTYERYPFVRTVTFGLNVNF